MPRVALSYVAIGVTAAFVIGGVIGWFGRGMGLAEAKTIAVRGVGESPKPAPLKTIGADRSGVAGATPSLREMSERLLASGEVPKPDAEALDKFVRINGPADLNTAAAKYLTDHDHLGNTRDVIVACANDPLVAIGPNRCLKNLLLNAERHGTLANNEREATE